MATPRDRRTSGHCGALARSSTRRPVRRACDARARCRPARAAARRHGTGCRRAARAAHATADARARARPGRAAALARRPGAGLRRAPLKRSSTRSRSQRAISTGRLARRDAVRAPLHFGHECVAEVLSVGERVTSGVGRASGWWCRSRSTAGAARPAARGGPATAQLPADLDVRLRGRRRALGRRVSDQLLVPYADGCSSRSPTASTRLPPRASPTTSATATATSPPTSDELLAREGDPSC